MTAGNPLREVHGRIYAMTDRDAVVAAVSLNDVGIHVKATGSAKREPGETNDTHTGQQLAIGRALIAAGQHLVHEAERQVRRTEAEQALKRAMIAGEARDGGDTSFGEAATATGGAVYENPRPQRGFVEVPGETLMAECWGSGGHGPVGWSEADQKLSAGIRLGVSEPLTRTVLHESATEAAERGLPEGTSKRRSRKPLDLGEGVKVARRSRRKPRLPE